MPGEVPEVPKLGSFEVMNRTIDIAQSALARHTLAAYPPDLLIEVPRSTCRSLEFHRAVEVIAAGRELATSALDALERERRRAATRDRGLRRFGESNAQEPRDRRGFAAALPRPADRRSDRGSAGSSGLGPKAANESSSANTVNVAAGNAAISAAGPAPNGDGVSAPDGTNTTATSQSSATPRLTELPTPPSM